MSDTPRHITRRPPLPATRALLGVGAPSATSPQRVEALRRMVAAGQYHVSPRFLAAKIYAAAGVKLPE